MSFLQHLKSIPIGLERVLKRPPPTVAPFHLDRPLLYFSPADGWTIRDACEGAAIMGSIGSGKTSGSGAAILKAFMRAGFGGLVMCAKPEERLLIERYAKETGRESSLVIFSPDHPHRFNFLDYELVREGRGAGQTENLVSLISQVIEIVEGKVDSGGGDPFWPRAMRELLRNAIDLLSISEGRITLEMVCNLITSAPQSLEESHVSKSEDDKPVLGEWWGKSFCAQCIHKMEGKEMTTRSAHDFMIAANYWLKSFPALSDRTRSNIVATFTSVADMLLHGIAWELLATETNIVPEVTYRDGAIIVLDLPIQEYQEVGRVVQGIFKLMFQRSILRRNVEQFPRPVFLWADEAQNFLSSFDYQVQAVARSARLCTVYLSQSISNYYAVLGANGKEQANALLGNFQTKIFHSNSDHNTNQYAADLIGQSWVVKLGGGTGAEGRSSTNWNETLAYKVLPEEFTTLRKGGPQNGLQVEGIVFQGGRVWNATGTTFLKSVFRQG